MGGRTDGRGGLGTNGTPAAKKPSGSGYSVRGEQADKEREPTWHEITLPPALALTV